MSDVRVVVVGNDTERRITGGLEPARRVGRVVEGPADPGVGLRDDERARGRGDVEQNSADVRVALGVEGRRRIAAGVERVPVASDELVEGRDLVTPGAAAIERPVVAAMVEADPGVVLPAIVFFGLVGLVTTTSSACRRSEQSWLTRMFSRPLALKVFWQPCVPTLESPPSLPFPRAFAARCALKPVASSADVTTPPDIGATNRSGFASPSSTLSAWSRTRLPTS